MVRDSVTISELKVHFDLRPHGGNEDGAESGSGRQTAMLSITTLIIGKLLWVLCTQIALFCGPKLQSAAAGTTRLPYSGLLRWVDARHHDRTLSWVENGVWQHETTTISRATGQAWSVAGWHACLPHPTALRHYWSVLA